MHRCFVIGLSINTSAIKSCDPYTGCRTIASTSDDPFDVMVTNRCNYKNFASPVIFAEDWNTK